MRFFRFLQTHGAEEAYSVLTNNRPKGYYGVLKSLNKAIDEMRSPSLPDDTAALEETLRTLLAYEKHHEKRLDEIRAKKRELEQRLQDLLNRR